ncbi:MAG: hypothetical protein Q7S10_03210 [bacterium]|nr:hypothetical protein [bacterium]
MINYKKYFFWVIWPYKHIVTPFWWAISMLVVFWVPFLRPWWWIFAPLFLSMELKVLYLWWIGWDFDYAKTKWIILEIIPPKEILVPLKAFEDVLSVMYGPLIDTANFREKWCEGELPEAPYWMSWEIVSIEGSIHFYARVMAPHRIYLESTLYSHYPELEIREVPDYTKDVPQGIPNEEWDLYGENFVTTGPDVYQIKTYEKFFEPAGEKISAEEKRIDPINSLLESMSRLGPGEQYWVQFIITSFGEREGRDDFEDEAKEIIGKLTKRPVKKGITFFQELTLTLRHLVLGPEKEGSGESASYSWAESPATSETGEREMLLTPGERETLTEIENKVKKPAFRTTTRGVYIAKRENWRSSNGKLLRTYVGHFSTNNNVMTFDGSTRTKVHYLFRKRRVFLRARRMLRNAILRFPPYFPDRRKGGAIFSPEELATFFHFPFKISSLAFPTVERVEHRKGGPPPNLPTGE